MSFINFNVEVIIDIFSFCDIRDFIACRVVCKGWYQVINSPFANWLWKNAFKSLIREPYIRNFTYDNSIINVASWRSKVYQTLPLISSTCPLEVCNILKSSRPSCRSGHTANIIDVNFLFLFGGASHLFIFQNDYDYICLESGDVLVSKCSIRGESPSPRWLHTSCSIDNRHVVIFGGQSENGFENDLYFFDFCLNSSLTPTVTGKRKRVETHLTPCPRAGHSMVLYDSSIDKASIYIFGGMTIGQEVLSDTYELRVSKRNGELQDTECSWNRLECSGQSPSARWCHSSEIVGVNMIIFGGWIYSRVFSEAHVFLNDVFVLNVSTVQWYVQYAES